MFDKLQENRFYIGRKGEGKSYFMSYNLCSLGDTFQVIVIDTHGDFIIKSIFRISSDKQSLEQISKGYNLLIDIPAFVRLGYDRTAVFNIVCKYIYSLGFSNQLEKPIVLAIDDCDMYFDRYDLPISLSNIIKYGRHFGIYFHGNTRRYTEIPKDIFTNTDKTYIGKSPEINDRKRIIELAGKDYLEKLDIADKYTFILIDENQEKSLVIAK
jgi:hypothetical protein